MTEGSLLYDRIGQQVGAKALGVSVERRTIWGFELSSSVGIGAALPRPQSIDPGSPPARRAAHRLLILGGIHGNEPSSTDALLDLATRRLATRADPNDYDDASFVLMIPALNPDGLVKHIKNNAHDVDLNRNFPAKNFVRSHAAGYDPGPSPLSEPESQLVAQLLATESIDAVVAVHAPFGCVNFDGPAKSWAEAVSQACGWPVWESIGYPTPGSLGTWLGVDCDMPILTLELPQGTLTDFRAAAAAALEMAIRAGSRLPLGPT